MYSAAARAVCMHNTTIRPEAKRQYRDKIRVILGIDLFTLSCNQQGQSNDANAHPGSLPLIDLTDLLSHLVLQTRYITAKQFKAHKSLEAYIQPIHQRLDKGGQSLGHQQ